ncbi:uncharacterized protein LOC119677957 [Teleopsis dalmanni]|uniref:uncharacterized protein LOC119677957 n=1 Tax=Teleopsis dalmanni TaxID=139649 RepID=UPI0018CFDC87|nr:uncharacterized protein LOC119677957 [Teleopsis dalmanni]
MEDSHVNKCAAVRKAFCLQAPIEFVVHKVRHIVDTIPLPIITEDDRQSVVLINDIIVKICNTIKPILDYPLPNFPQLRIELEEINLKMTFIRQQAAMTKTDYKKYESDKKENSSVAKKNEKRLELMYSNLSKTVIDKPEDIMKIRINNINKDESVQEENLRDIKETEDPLHVTYSNLGMNTIEEQEYMMEIGSYNTKKDESYNENNFSALEESEKSLGFTYPNDVEEEVEEKKRLNIVEETEVNSNEECSSNYDKSFEFRDSAEENEIQNFNDLEQNSVVISNEGSLASDKKEYDELLNTIDYKDKKEISSGSTISKQDEGFMFFCYVLYLFFQNFHHM